MRTAARVMSGIAVMAFITRTIIAASVLVIALAGHGCSRHDEARTPRKTTTMENTAKTKPAQDDRWAKVVANYEKIEPGMTQQEVRQILGQPDHIHPLFQPRKRNPRRIGSSWFYMKDPKPDSPGDTTVVVRLDTSGKVTRVDSWGISGQP